MSRPTIPFTDLDITLRPVYSSTHHLPSPTPSPPETDVPVLATARIRPDHSTRYVRLTCRRLEFHIFPAVPRNASGSGSRQRGEPLIPLARQADRATISSWHLAVLLNPPLALCLGLWASCIWPPRVFPCEYSCIPVHARALHTPCPRYASTGAWLCRPRATHDTGASSRMPLLRALKMARSFPLTRSSPGTPSSPSSNNPSPSLTLDRDPSPTAACDTSSTASRSSPHARTRTNRDSFYAILDDPIFQSYHVIADAPDDGLGWSEDGRRPSDAATQGHDKQSTRTSPRSRRESVNSEANSSQRSVWHTGSFPADSSFFPRSILFI